MSTNFEMKQWLTGVGVPSDKLDAVLETLGPYADKVKGEVMAQSDYSRNMDALRAEKAQVATTQTELNAWRDTYVTQEKPMLTNRIKQLETDNAALAITLRHDAGIDPATVIGRTPWGNSTQPPANQPPPTNPAQPPYPGTTVTQPPTTDAMTYKQGESMALGVMMASAMFNDLQPEHQRLFGEPFKQVDTVGEYLKAVATSPNLSPQEFWEQKYNVGQKRQELATTSMNAQLEAARQEGYNKARAEVLPPGATPRPSEMLNSMSPVMRSLFGADPNATPPPGTPPGTPPATPPANDFGAAAAQDQAYWHGIQQAQQKFHDDPDAAKAVINQYSILG